MQTQLLIYAHVQLHDAHASIKACTLDREAAETMAESAHKDLSLRLATQSHLINDLNLRVRTAWPAHFFASHRLILSAPARWRFHQSIV